MTVTPGPDQLRDPVARDRVVRDVASVALIGLGCLGLLTAGFLASPLVGFGVLSVLVIAAGVVVGVG